MKIAAAQIKSTVGDIKSNLRDHYDTIKVAAKHNAKLILFPEMSITGYCRAKGKSLAFNQNDERLNRLKDLSKEHDLTIIAGAPIAIKNELYIGSFVIKPSGDLSIYTKQFLHRGEEVFYANSFDYNPVLELESEKILLAICADIDSNLHPQLAKQKECTIYMASIFFSNIGITNGQETLSKYAKEYSFDVLMSNYCGTHWGIEAGGKSGFWNKEGIKVAELDPMKEGILIAEKIASIWEVKTVVLEEMARR